MPRLLVMFVTCLLVCAGSMAQESTPEDAPPPPQADPRFESPRAVLTTFSQAMRDAREAELLTADRTRALRLATECFDIETDADIKGPELAFWMSGTLSRIGDLTSYLPGSSLDEIADGVTTFVLFPNERLTGKGVALILPGYRDVERALPSSYQITLTKGEGGEWRFSRETVEQIGEIYRRIEFLPVVTGDESVALTPSQWIASRMPATLRRGDFLSVSYWQWACLGILIFIGVVLDFSVRAVLRRVWNRLIDRGTVKTDRVLLGKAVRPIGLLTSAILFFWSVRLLGLQPRALDILLLAVRVFLMLSAVWAAYRITDLLAAFFGRKAARTSTKVDDLLVPLLRKTAKVFVTAFGLIYLARSLNIDVLPLLTGLSIGGLAFTFAAKDTVENLFGSVAVILDRPFEVGDWVVIGDVEGTVEELGFRSTRVRTFYNSIVVVPNSLLVRATVDNYGQRRYRRYKTHLALTYDTPPDRIDAFCEGVRELIRAHPYTRKDYYHVYLHQMGASSLDILIYMFHDCPDWSVELRERHRLLTDILRLASHLGVEFAFPTQTLHLERGDAPPLSPLEADALTTGREAAREITADAPWTHTKPGPVLFPGGTDANPG